MRPEVLLIMNGCIQDCETMLRGISRYQCEHEPWKVYIDRGGQAEADPGWVAAHPWKGVISRTTTTGLVEACRALGVPLVDLNDSESFPGVTKIRSDNRAIGHMAAEDLYERGYRHMYFCGYPNRLWSIERRDGFFEALSLLGCAAEEFSLPHGCTLAPDENASVIRRMAAWLKTLVLPAAVMAAHDLRANQLVSAAELAGLRVPDELAVLGVNNDEMFCELAMPPLSSVATNGFQTGYFAAEELVRLMAGGVAPRHEILVEPLKVITRRSTNSLAIEDRAISRALALIRDRACEGITVAEVMRGASISRGRLETGFRHYLGRSPMAEIRRVQVARIKQLLTETDLPLKQIAVMTGYEHVEYLNVSFKRMVGETPGRFRRTVRSATAAIGPVATAA